MITSAHPKCITVVRSVGREHVQAICHTHPDWAGVLHTDRQSNAGAILAARDAREHVASVEKARLESIDRSMCQTGTWL